MIINLICNNFFKKKKKTEYIIKILLLNKVNYK